MADLTEKIKNLTDTIGRDFVKTDDRTTAQYAIDGLTPAAVIFPKNTAEASAVIKFANQHHLAVVPWGSGSRIRMGNPPRKLDLVVCTRRMNHMLDVDTQNLTITVEAGVKLRDIQARLATEEDRCYLPLEDLDIAADEIICSDRSHSGCFIPLDPPGSEKATIGGIIAANASGPRRLLYNLPRDTILGVRFVTPQGDVPGSGGKTVKNVSGYDISKLMVGSMGSLGLITEMTFRLMPLPEKMQTLLFGFASLSDAHAFADGILKTKLLPAAVETMNAAAYEHLGFTGAPDFSPGRFVVAISLEAFAPAVDRMAREMRQTAADNGAVSSALFGEHPHQQFWLAVSDQAARLAAEYGNLIRAKANYRISQWKDIIEFTDNALAALKIQHTIQAHSGSGICLINLLLNENADGLKPEAAAFLEKLLQLSRKAGGNTVIQAAPADMKPMLKIWGETGSDFVAMKLLKKQLDPNDVMSPGRFVGGL